MNAGESSVRLPSFCLSGMRLRGFVLGWVTCLLSLGAAPTNGQEQGNEVSAKNLTVSELPITDEDRDHWSFRPRRDPRVPTVADPGAARTSIDRFVLARLDELKLTMQPPASREVLLRRLCFDLLGLPPTREQRRRFLADASPDAYEQLVDRLLASPQHGERWGQHWLELARFAETDGYEHDKVRSQAWRYRDWVIGALNRDLSFDRFVSLQIAGDRLQPQDPSATWATGFCTSGPDMPDINSQQERRHEFLNEMTSTVGSAILGLQIGCAQCHDHKYDPISQLDFYRLRSFFDDAVTFQKNRSVAFLSPTKSSSESRLMVRGDWRRPGLIVTPGAPRIAYEGKSGGQLRNRIGLAEWMVRPDNPLTARVFVNRVWQQHFGEGLSRTPSDFGVMSDEPVFPNLLDHLASRFIANVWSIKELHRSIVCSAVYRQSSQPVGTRIAWRASLERDPDNAFLSRFPRRRLDGESIRDAMLQISGRLNGVAGGPGVRPPLPKELVGTLLRNQWTVDKDPSNHVRRSIYVFARRNLRFPIFEAFDRPDANASCARRNLSTTAPQSLILLNGELTIDLAQRAAGQVALSGNNIDARINDAFLRIVARPPTKSEHDEVREFLHSQSRRLHAENEGQHQRLPIPTPPGAASSESLHPAVWTDLCVALFNSNAFVYID